MGVHKTAVAVAVSLLLAFTVNADLASDIESCTGGQTRIVWAKSGKIYGVDTRDGKGIRTIMNISKSIDRMDIATDGNHVVYTSGESEIWSVKWDGTDNKKLRSGALTSVWKDPQSGTDYVLYLDGFSDGSKPIKKFPLGSPTTSSTVIDAPVGWCFFNLSADGKYGGIEYSTWGNIGVIDMATQKYQGYFQSEFGCQCQIAPDNSYYFLGLTDYVSGAHPDYTIWKQGAVKVKTFTPPKNSCGYPRWVLDRNKTRSIVIISPDKSGDVYLIKHSDDMSSVQKTVQVSTGGGCAWPAAWVGSVETGLNYGNVNKPVVHSTRTVNQYFTVQGRTVESCEKISAGITIKNGEKRVLNLRSKIGEK